MMIRATMRVSYEGDIRVQFGGHSLGPLGGRMPKTPGLSMFVESRFFFPPSTTNHGRIVPNYWRLPSWPPQRDTT